MTTALICLTTLNTWAATPKKNVLFIAVDDLRPELGCYGHAQMMTPNLDRLAQGGVLFRRAYCQQAICAASRSSLLSGCRPDTTGIYDLNTPLRQAMPDVLTIPQFFHDHGYRTISLGKIYHHANDDQANWDVLDRCDLPAYQDPAVLAWIVQRSEEADQKGLKGQEKRRYCQGPPTECCDVTDETYSDGLIARRAIAEIERHGNTPLFLAVGFKKPHLPFVAPKKYWDLYDRNTIAVPSRDRPKGAPELAFTNWGELRNYSQVTVKNDVIGDDDTRKYIHAYYACVSYTDAQIGRVIQALKEKGLLENTLIVLWGDHGWKLGEYGDWCKHTNFELDTHAPLIFSGPGIPVGRSTDALAEFVDIYPTLAALAGYEVPVHCEGVSLVPLFENLDRPWKQAAFSQYPRGKIMGYSIRSGSWRYTEWRDEKIHQITERELYDHTDSDLAQANLVDHPEQRDLVKKLSAIMAAGPDAAKPQTD